MPGNYKSLGQIMCHIKHGVQGTAILSSPRHPDMWCHTEIMVLLISQKHMILEVIKNVIPFLHNC